MEKEIAVVAMGELVRVMVKSIVDEPNEVTVSVDTRNVGRVLLTVDVAPNDLGKVIGKQGRNARALRTILGAAGMAFGVPSSLNIREGDGDAH
jgi:predicted RNA-binding protein YlqC (UPF0109 family)